MALNFQIDIENAAGVKQGSGPITSATHWRYTARLDEAGDFSFEMPASDPKAALVQKKMIARAYALLGPAGGLRVEVGAGIIDQIERQPDENGAGHVTVSGNDLIRELTYRSVLNLKLYTGGNPVSHAAAVAAVASFAPAGWTIGADSTPPNNSVYGYFNGETVLSALIKTAEKSQNHFYRSTGRTLNFASTFTPSGLRAIKAPPGAALDLGAITCAITDISELQNLYDLLTRIYPRGSGNADAQLTLRASTRAAPAGYTVDRIANYIENTGYAATYGRIEQQLDFREIGPVSNTTPDIVSASNMLFDAALETLKRRSVELDDKSYTISLAGCGQLLRPMQTIRVVYRDLAAGLDINRDLNILESTWEVSQAGLYTTGLTVSSADRKPPDDQSVMVGTVGAGRIYQALPQLSANSYVTAYRVNVDKDNIAGSRFRFGNEVTQLQQVLYEFQLLPFESTVKSVGGASGGSGALATTGPSTDVSGASSGANNTSGAPSVPNSGAPSVTNTGAPSVTNTGAAAGNTGAALGNTGSATGNTGGNAGNTSGPSLDATGVSSSDYSGPSSADNTSGPDVNATQPSPTTTTEGAFGNTAGPDINASGIPSVPNTGTAAGNTGGGVGASDAPNITDTGGNSDQTGLAVGGDSDGAGQHQHVVNVIAGSGNLGSVTLHHSGSNYYLSNSFVTGSEQVYTDVSGGHTHSMQGHTHSLGGHTHSLSGHTHGLAGHSHDLGNHSHSLNNHSHSLSSHTHGLNNHSHSLSGHSHPIPHAHSMTHTHNLQNHTHTLGGHTHTMNGHAHDLGSHAHDLGGHTHDLGSHSHDLGNHTHSLGNHTHGLSAHTHSLSNHIHSLADSIVALYGIFRDSAANTFGLADLQYRVNGGAWRALTTAVSVTGGWWRLDITADVMDATTYRPIQENNLLEIGPVSSSVDKRAMIDAQLSVRNVIQAIAYS
jgi:hypothetical protein